MILANSQSPNCTAMFYSLLIPDPKMNFSDKHTSIDADRALNAILGFESG
jgi:hypothetical protein